MAATYVLNRSPKEELDVTPWEFFAGERPDVSRLAVWDGTTLALRPPRKPSGVPSQHNCGKDGRIDAVWQAVSRIARAHKEGDRAP